MSELRILFSKNSNSCSGTESNTNKILFTGKTQKEIIAKCLSYSKSQKMKKLILINTLTGKILIEKEMRAGENRGKRK
jgi:hypothetical protein